MKIISKIGGLSFKEIHTKTGKISYALSKSQKNKDTGDWEDQTIWLWDNEIENLKKIIEIASDYLVKVSTAKANNAINKSKPKEDITEDTSLD